MTELLEMLRILSVALSTILTHWFIHFYSEKIYCKIYCTHQN